MSKNNIITFGIGQMATGRARWQVLDSNGHVVKEAKDWTRNLILNAGMEYLGADNRFWCNCFTSCGVGTGTTANTEDSGVTTATQSGTTVTLAGGSWTFSAANATGGGDVIAWDTGERARITAYTGPTQVTVAENQSVSAGQFTLVHTNQTGLVTPIKWYSAYLSGAANCNTTRSGNVLLHRRTYDFTAEAGPVTYNEVSLNWASNNSSVFSRLLFPPGGVTLAAGQQIRIIYELMIALGPTSPVYYPGGTVVGWPSGDFYLQLSYVGMSSVSTTGATSWFDSGGYWLNEPGGNLAYGQSFWVNNAATALPTFPGGGPGYGTNYTTAASFVMDAYVPYSFERGRTAYFATGEANHTVRFFGVGTGYPGFGAQYTYTGLLGRWVALQTKDSEHTLTMKYKVSWSRNIVV